MRPTLRSQCSRGATASTSVVRRGYTPAPRRGGHRLSASPHVVSIDRRTGCFTVEANTARLGLQRSYPPAGTLALTVTAPLMELPPGVRRRLVLNQVLDLRVSGRRSDPLQRRWTARYWTSGQIRAMREDAARLHARLTIRPLMDA